MNLCETACKNYDFVVFLKRIQCGIVCVCKQNQFSVEFVFVQYIFGVLFMNENVQHVFLVGAKSLGAYGGYETFVDKLTEYHQSNQHIQYHIAYKANGIGCMDESQLDL